MARQWVAPSGGASVCGWRSAVAAMGLALLIAGCASSRSSGPPTAQHDLCAVFAQYPEWHDIARDVERRWGAPVPVMMAIMQQESSFRADARPPVQYAGIIPIGRASSAYGFAQAIDGTWDWYREETGNSGADRTEFEDAADFVGWYMAKTVASNGVGMHDTRNQYLAYHEGHAGFRRGSYNEKAWLLAVADRVAQRAVTYRGQLGGCS